MNTTARPLTYQQLLNTIAALPPPPPRLRIYYTPFATQDQTITRTWKERLFTLPWRPRQRYKLQTQPTIYIAHIPQRTLPIASSQGQVILVIAHPAFKNAIEKALGDQSQ